MTTNCYAAMLLLVALFVTALWYCDHTTLLQHQLAVIVCKRSWFGSKIRMKVDSFI